MSENKEFIVKRILHAGTAPVDFKDGTKIFFHFQTRLCDKAGTIIDDSKVLLPKKPMELVLGKKFKLEVWEAILQKMALGEVAEFTVNKSLVIQYPFVAKTLRDIVHPEKKHKHLCAMTLQSEGVGYDDLNDLLKNPQDLKFIMDVLKVEQPGEYEKETWQMDNDERIDMVPKLKATGNEEYNKKNFKAASEMYAKAIGILEQLKLREKPHDEDWNKLNDQMMPILLNFAQCKLNEEDYYAVITHCTEVLKYDKDNVKAYFRRAKAHIAVWNPTEARDDLNKVMELDKSVIPLAKKELSRLEDMQRTKNIEDKEKLKKIFS